MTPVIRIDEDVMEELKKKAIELNMVFNTPNEVLKVILGCTRPVYKASDVNFPQSSRPHVQKLLDGIRDVIFKLSPSGLTLSKNKKWIASPNIVTIKVQDVRKGNLAITVYGEPEDFNRINHNLDIRPDRNSYSGFSIDRDNQLSSAIEVIKYSYQLKVNNRGR
jgi:formyltetrahydrofolate synthetase